MGWVSVSVSPNMTAGWKEREKVHSHNGQRTYSSSRGGHTFSAAYEIEGEHLYPFSSPTSHLLSNRVLYFQILRRPSPPQPADLTHNHSILSIYELQDLIFSSSQMYHQKQHHPEFHLMYEQKNKKSPSRTMEGVILFYKGGFSNCFY